MGDFFNFDKLKDAVGDAMDDVQEAVKKVTGQDGNVKDAMKGLAGKDEGVQDAVKNVPVKEEDVKDAVKTVTGQEGDVDKKKEDQLVELPQFMKIKTFHGSYLKIRPNGRVAHIDKKGRADIFKVVRNEEDCSVTLMNFRNDYLSVNKKNRRLDSEETAGPKEHFRIIAYRDGVALKSNHHFGEGDNISKQQFSSYFKEGIDKTKTSRQQLDSYLLIDTDTGRDHQYISAVQGKKRVKLTDTLGDCEYFQVEKMEGMKKYRMKPELFIEADKGLRAMNKTICLAVKEAKQNKEEAKRQLKEAARNLSRVVVAAKETAKQEIVERAQATVKAMDDAIDTAVDEAEEASDKAMKVLFGLADSVVDVMDDIEDVVTEVASTSVNVSLSVN
mmetsp:Transcript_20605/g.28645  ORF Transcript_20605/g.28645 Transcript_20605/m.28645 type:complete len:387 (-) Transcript_20605:432-1592(-)